MPNRRTRGNTPGLTHVDDAGRLRMVDVGGKPVTDREAIASGFVHVNAATLRLVRAGQVKKGNAIEAARLAGIMAAKRTSDLIPLCHPLALTHVSVDITARRGGFAIRATARTSARTGVEMEALTAVSAAALTIYDMLKASDKAMVIGDIRLVRKTGGTTGPTTRPGQVP